MKGQTPDPNLIQEPNMRRLVEEFDLMEEMFGKKAKGQVEANKQVAAFFAGTCSQRESHR